MKKYIVYKALGGIITALSLPGLIVEVLRLNTYATGPHINWSRVILSTVIGFFGLYVFIVSGNKLKAIENDIEASGEKINRGTDWKAIIITAIVFILFVLYVLFHG